MIASSDESTIASYRSSDGMKSDLRLIVGNPSQNRNPEGFRPRTNRRTDGEFGILGMFRCADPGPVGGELHRSRLWPAKLHRSRPALSVGGRVAPALRR